MSAEQSAKNWITGLFYCRVMVCRYYLQVFFDHWQKQRQRPEVPPPPSGDFGVPRPPSLERQISLRRASNLLRASSVSSTAPRARARSRSQRQGERLQRRVDVGFFEWLDAFPTRGAVHRAKDGKRFTKRALDGARLEVSL